MLPRPALLATLAALVAIGCVGPQTGRYVRSLNAPPAPELIPRYGTPWPSWNEVTMQHVVVRSPASVPETEGLAVDIERTLTTLRDVGFRDVELRGSLLVFFFEDRTQYARYVDDHSVGLFHPSSGFDLDGRPVVYVCGCNGVPHRHEVLQHELTHFLMSQAYGATPRWVSEGLAQYFGTLAVRDGYAYLGTPSDERGVIPVGTSVVVDQDKERVLYPLSMVPKPSLFAFGIPSSFRPDPRHGVNAAYAGDLLAVHLFMNGTEAYRSRFADYLERIRHGAAFRAAFRTAFADVSPEQLDADFTEHAREQPVLKRKAYVEIEPQILGRRSLPPAAIASMIARMGLGLGRPDIARAALDRVRADGAKDAETLSWRALLEAHSHNWDEATALAERARAIAPGDSRPLVAAAFVSIEQSASEKSRIDEARLRAILRELEPRASTPFETALVALLRLNDGRVDAAIEAGEDAFRRDKSCRACAITLALALERSQHYERAIEIEERVINLATHVGDPKASARLAALRARIAEAAPPADNGSAPPVQAPSPTDR